MRLRSFVVPAVLAAFSWAASAAEDSVPVVRGTAGLVEVAFTASNEGPGEIACSASLAHWYSLDLGQAVPGGQVQASLWYNPKDGIVVLLNAANDRMPVQALWCGLAGRSWATRTLIRLERKVGVVPSPIRLTCRPEAEKLSCR